MKLIWRWRGREYAAAFLGYHRFVIVRGRRGNASIYKVIRTRWLSDLIWAAKRIKRRIAA